MGFLLHQREQAEISKTEQVCLMQTIVQVPTPRVLGLVDG